MIKQMIGRSLLKGFVWCGVATASHAAIAATEVDMNDASYSLGYDIGSRMQEGFKMQGIDVNAPNFSDGVKDAIAGAKPRLSIAKMQGTLRDMQQQMLEQREMAIQKAAADYRAGLLATANYPIAGNPNGDVTVVEFFDYRCPHCKNVRGAIEDLIKADPNVRVVYRDFPILGPDSVLAAKAALAANLKGQYYALHNALLDETKPLNEALIKAAAKRADINWDFIANNLENKDVLSALKGTQRLAEDIELIYTPGFFVLSSDPKHTNSLKFITGEPSESALEQAVKQVRQTS